MLIRKTSFGDFTKKFRLIKAGASLYADFVMILLDKVVAAREESLTKTIATTTL